MVKLKQVLFGVCMVFASLSHAGEYADIRSAVKQIYSAPKEFNQSDGFQYSMGSAVVIAPGYVLTARHVVNRTNNFTFVGESIEAVQKGYVAKMSSEAIDLALVAVPGLQCPCISVDAKNPDTDTKVVYAGFPLYKLIGVQFVNDGIVEGYLENGTQMITNVQFAPGSSGGGVFIKRGSTYKLVGIASSVVTMKEPVNSGVITQIIPWLSDSISVQAIREFLKGTPAAQ